jgi:hypothetical protein
MWRSFSYLAGGPDGGRRRALGVTAHSSGKRRGHGEDSIYWDASRNRYIGAVDLGLSPDGTRIRKKVIQAVVPRPAVVRLLGDARPRTRAVAAGLGAASSSCSYAAEALTRALFRAPAPGHRGHPGGRAHPGADVI